MPLTYAAAMNLHHVVNYLSLRRCDLDAEDPDGLTVLSRYALFDQPDLVKKIFARGADIDYCNREGKTALVLAV